MSYDVKLMVVDTSVFTIYSESKDISSIPKFKNGIRLGQVLSDSSNDSIYLSNNDLKYKVNNTERKVLTDQDNLSQYITFSGVDLTTTQNITGLKQFNGIKLNNVDTSDDIGYFYRENNDLKYIDSASSVRRILTTSEVNQSNGVVGLDSASKINNTYLNGNVFNRTFTANDSAAMLALSGVLIGDYCKRIDNGYVYVFIGGTISDATNWIQLNISISGGSGGVISVNGNSGVVTLTKSDIGLSNVVNSQQLTTSNNLNDLANRQTGLNTLAGAVTANRFLRGNGTNIVLAQVSLNTSDVTGILATTNGGTGSNTKNFIDLTTAQNISGIKTFLDGIIIGTTNTVEIGSSVDFHSSGVNNDYDSRIIGSGGDGSVGNGILSIITNTLNLSNDLNIAGRLYVNKSIKLTSTDSTELAFGEVGYMKHSSGSILFYYGGGESLVFKQGSGSSGERVIFESNGNLHSITGSVASRGGTIPSTAIAQSSIFSIGGNSYLALISSASAPGHKLYDICNEEGAFNIRSLNDTYTGINNFILTLSVADQITLGDVNTKSLGSYGSISVRGATNGWSGIHFVDSFNQTYLMLDQTTFQFGLWNANSGTNDAWMLLYNNGNFQVKGTGGVSEGTYIALNKGLGSLPGYNTSRYPTIATDHTSLYFAVGNAFVAYIDLAGTYTAVSNYYEKTVIEELNDQETLNIIKYLPVCRYSFNNDDQRINHIGTFAQSFWLGFRTGGDIDIIKDSSPINPLEKLSISDVAGVCLSGIKGLLHRIEQLESKIQ